MFNNSHMSHTSDNNKQIAMNSLLSNSNLVVYEETNMARMLK